MAAAEWGALSLISAPWYRPPREAFAVALTALATLIPLDTTTAPHLAAEVTILRNASIAFCVALAVAAAAAMVIDYGGRWERHRQFVRSLADRFSGGPLVFGMIALVSIFGFYESEGARLLLVALWFGFALSRPFEWLLVLLTRLGIGRAAKAAQPLIGRVRRVDHPDIVRFALEPGVRWDGKAFARAVKQAAMDPATVTPHVMRHTAITRLVKAGVDLPTIQRVSGHKTLSMVLRYSHVDGPHIDAATEALAIPLGITPKLHTPQDELPATIV